MGVYRLGSIIKYTRLSKGLTQNELSEGICSVETLSRYESGKIAPSREKFALLMKKMNEDDGRYILPIESHNTDIDKIVSDILFAKSRMEYEDVECKLEELLNHPHFNGTLDSNRQFVELMKALLDYQNKKVTTEEYISRLEECLRITFKDYKEDFRINRIFTQTEINIINNIAYAYGRAGKREKAICILEKLEEYFEKYNGIDDGKEYNKVLLTLSNELGLAGRYDESIAKCNKGIQWLRANNKSGSMYNFVYNLSWNILHKNSMQLDKESDEYKLAKKYAWQSYKLNEMFEESEITRHMGKEYYNNFFVE